MLAREKHLILFCQSLSDSDKEKSFIRVDTEAEADFS
jgi:hypothetical protein